MSAGDRMAEDHAAIARAKGLLHRVGPRHECKCEDCQALRRVVILAREAVEMKAAKRRRESTYTEGVA